MQKRMKGTLCATLLVVAAALLVGCSTKNNELKVSTLLAQDATGVTCDGIWDIATQTCIPDTNVDSDNNSGGGDIVVPPSDCGEGNYWDPNSQSCVPGSAGGGGGGFVDNGMTDDGECDPATGICVKPEQNQYQEQNQNQNNMGQGGSDCFGEGNEDCREKALKADYRDIERMQRELKQMMKENSDKSTEFQGYLDQLDALETELDNASSQDEVDSIRSEVWAIRSVMDQFRMAAEITRMEKDNARMEKQWEKDKKYLNDMLNTVSSELKAKIKEQLARIAKMGEVQAQLLDALKGASSATDSMTYMDSIDDLRWEMDDLNWEMNDFWQSFQDVKNQQFATQMFDQLEKDIQIFLDSSYKNLSDDMRVKADEVIEIARTLVEEGRAAAESGDEDLLAEIQMRLDELRMKSEKFLGKSKPKFDELGFDSDMNQSFENYSGDMSYDQQVELVKKILSANPDIIQQVLLNDPVLAEKTLKIFNRIPTDLQSGYLASNADLVGIYDEITAKDSSITSYKDDILGYNYFGAALDELVGLLEEVRDGTLKLSDVVSKLDDLKQTSKDLKYQAGVVSFQDYDDSDWYYEYVETMNEDGFIKGKQTNEGFKFAGGDNITFAETLKIVLEKFEKGQTDGTPAYSGAQNHWAKGYYVTAEQMGLTLMAPDKLITRGEMARLIIEATVGDPGNYTYSSFSDLNASDPYFNYIEALAERGVLSGDSTSSGMPTIRSGDNINRAETAKVVDAAYDSMQLEVMNVSDFDYLLEFSSNGSADVNWVVD
ncbi:MAG: S-layer homology domain-containing protein [Candidatus Peregrinibacteria bacterium]